MPGVISARKLTSLMREWQKLLRLQDWKISIRWATAEELKKITGIDAIGGCQPFAEARQATILLVPPTEEDDERCRDIENTIVHELLHCHFAPFQSQNEAVKLQHEQAIEPLTDALLMLKRKKVAGTRSKRSK